MSYDELADLLFDRPRVRTLALPDGSVDRFYRVRGAGGDRIDRRADVADALASGRTGGFRLERVRTEPGGHCVNMAEQAHALGDEVVCYGHLDHPTFDDLPFETVSMGRPTVVDVHVFDDGDVTYSSPSPELESWSLSKLRRVVGDRLDPLGSADVALWSAWADPGRMAETFEALAETDLGGGVLVFDPADIDLRPREGVRRLADALGDVEGFDAVVVSANGEELDSIADVLGLDDPLADLRDRVSSTAVVRHEADAAAVATAAGTATLPNLDVEVEHRIGGGDRFDAGLALALATGAGWETALALGNLCASYHVAEGGSGTPGELLAFLDRHR